MIKQIYSLLGYNYKKASQKQKNDAYIELCNICNAKCIFCPYPEIAKSNKKLQNMSEEIFDNVLLYLKKLNIKNISFTPTTGEILLNKDWNNYLQKALNEDSFERIHFYSNAILLNKQNIERILNLTNIQKLKRISFSVGGIDTTSYLNMYKVDKFNKVKENINNLNQKLKKINSNIKITCEFRLPKNISKINKNELYNTFNTHSYSNFEIDIMSKFANIDFMEASSNEINFLKKPVYTTPCIDLNTYRFAVNGDIWLCGCVVSELPNDTSLKIGNIFDSSYKEILKNQNKIIKNWDTIIPLVCQNCDIYTPRK